MQQIRRTQSPRLITIGNVKRRFADDRRVLACYILVEHPTPDNE
jgi:hypothetical protein